MHRLKFPMVWALLKINFYIELVLRSLLTNSLPFLALQGKQIFHAPSSHFSKKYLWAIRGHTSEQNTRRLLGPRPQIKKKEQKEKKRIVIERTERESGMRMAWGPKPKADGLVPGKPGRTAFQAEGR